MRLNKPVTEYDRTVRMLDHAYKTRRSGEQYNRLTIKRFVEHPYQNIAELRSKLVKRLRFYRNPANMEQYHSTFLKIQTKLEGIVPFHWKIPQRVLYYNYILPRIIAGKPIRIYLLKARQIGFSTLIEGIGSSLCNLFSDIRATVVAHDMYTSSEIFRMCKLFYKSLPEHFRPARKISNRKELELANPRDDGELGLESKFSVNTAGNLHLGAGTTLRFIHLSEFARYEEVNNEAETALGSLFQTIPELGGTSIFIETTAYGEGIGKRFWDANNGFEKIFISFLAEDSYSSDEPLLEELGYDDNHQFGNELLAKTNIINELKVWNPDFVNDDEWLQHEALKRLNWRRQYIKDKCFGKVELFQQEYPITPEEAFRVSGRCVFNTYRLIELKKRSDLISCGQYEYNHIDNKLGTFVRNSLGELKVFKTPVPGELYFIGADTGAGTTDVAKKENLPGDPSSLQVFNEKYDQCAVYHNIMEPDELAYPLVTLAKIYNNAKIIPEANAMGVSLISRVIKDLKYTNVYIRKRVNTIDGSLMNEWGFYTSSKTRPLIINKLRSLITSGKLTLNDIDTIIQFLNFVFLTKKGTTKMTANTGFHDDLVLATGLAVVDIEDIVEQMDEDREAPYGSIEWYAQKQDHIARQSDFGSVTGLS